MLSRAVVVTTIGNFSALAALAKPTTLCALILVDHQVGLMTGVRDYSTGELKHSKADMAANQRDVCFTPESGHSERERYVR